MKLFLLFFLFSFQLFAANEVGTVAVIRGEAELIRGSETQKINPNQVIQEKDKIVVKNGGFVKALLRDDSIITIDSNTNFVFEKFEAEDKNSRKVNFKLNKGKVRALITKKLRKGFIKLKTKSLTMGVRGTEFLVNSIIKDGKEVSIVGVIEGLVSVTPTPEIATNLPSGEVLIKEGELISSVGLQTKGEKAVETMNPQIFEGLQQDKQGFLPSIGSESSTESEEVKKESSSNENQEENSSSDQESVTIIEEAKVEQEKVVESMETTVEELENNNEQVDVDSTVSEVNDRNEDIQDKTAVQEEINSRIENLDLEGLDPKIKDIINDTLNKQ